MDHLHSDDLESALLNTESLAQLLEQEFEALKSREISTLQNLDQAKTQLLIRLQVHADTLSRAEEVSEQWVMLRDRLRECREMHFRNFQLLRRQLDAVQGALHAMLGDDQVLPGLYDKLGKVSRLSGVRAYQAI